MKKRSVRIGHYRLPTGSAQAGSRTAGYNRTVFQKEFLQIFYASVRECDTLIRQRKSNSMPVDQKLQEEKGIAEWRILWKRLRLNILQMQLNG